ncbi:MAG: CRISPR-associated endonuclease Cas2 [Anaerolineae bacterium]|nr:CRISPR-associated endonuclease Cas2 [Anaerolineae bacterium]
MFILISYDIPDDKRRNKIAKILEDYGERVQYSVFECDLSARHYQKLVKELQAVMDDAADSLRLYPLCADCKTKVTALGQAQPPAEPPTVYIV